MICAAAFICIAPRTSWSGQAGIEGEYHHGGRVSATLEVRRVRDGWAVRLQGGGARDAGAGVSADCVVEARGMLHGRVLDAHFGPVETAEFSYGPEQAQREHRELQIVFRPRSARVTVADTFGYCGLAATLIGPYRMSLERTSRGHAKR